MLLYKNDRDEWKLIEKKAKKFIKSCNIEDKVITAKIEAAINN